MSPWAVLALGFFFGMRHATDADHVVAVSTIVSRQRSLRAAAPVGVLWGVGHTLTIVLVGGAIIVFGVVIPPRIGLAMEACVAAMLVVLGVRNLRTVVRADGRGHVHSMRPLAVGIVHGLAGSAAVALLVLGSIRNAAWAMGYLLVFGVGTIAGMLLITTALAMPVAAAARRFERLHRGLEVARIHGGAGPSPATVKRRVPRRRRHGPDVIQAARRSRWLQCAAVMALCTACAPYLGAHGGGTSFEVVNGHIFVAATLEGHGPYRFLLDTGANTSIVCAEVANELGLARHAVVTVEGVGYEAKGGHSSEVPSIEVGGATVENVDVIIGASRADMNVSGVLGGSFLRPFRVVLDFERSHVDLIAR